MPFVLALALLFVGCASLKPSPAPAAVEPMPQLPQAGLAAPAGAAQDPSATSGDDAAAGKDAALASGAEKPGAAGSDDADDDDGTDGAPEEPGETGEGESHAAIDGAAPGIRYTQDLSDPELQRLWKATPAALGSMSVGFVDAGRLLNGVQFPEGEGWTVVTPAKAWGTAETIASIQAAIRTVRAQFPNAPLLRVNQISAQDGGYIRPHQSHQNGRDADLAFYYPTAEPVRARARENVIDLQLNWALVKALATQTDVQMILVDRRVQKRLIDFAIAHGEDRLWVDSIFHGKDALIKHARGHRDHFHVRFFNPRAQELGRRVAPLLAQQPEMNVAMHRVRRGDNLGAIARKYGSTVAMIRKLNHLQSNALRVGITLSVPLRGACVHCPVPPAMVLPARRLPPPVESAIAARSRETASR